MHNYNTIVLLVILFFGLLLANTTISFAQKAAKDSVVDSQAYSQKSSRKLPVDTIYVSKGHKVTINGKKIPYKIILGTLPVYGENDTPIAYLFYYYYKRTGVKKETKRPILFTFNGGPGSSSVWQLLGYTSPKRVKVSKEGFPVEPEGVVDNHHSLIDAADLVYVDPVNTGYSRMLNKGKPKDFFTTKSDTKYLSHWIAQFLSVYDRWLSPKFLLGESYGTSRVAGLAGRLEGYGGEGGFNSINDVYLDGVILVSGGGGIGRSRRIPRTVLSLPHYTAMAWYFKKLSSDLEHQKLKDLLPKVERFAMDKLLPAVARGGSIDEAKRQSLAAEIAKYSGLPKQFVLSHNLTVPSSAFEKELLRKQGKALGGLDGRYLAPNKTAAGTKPQWQAAIAPWSHTFGPALNHYLQKDLGFKTDLKYYVLKEWPKVKGQSFFGGGFNTGKALRVAMEKNPALQVLFQYGYFDGGFFDDVYASWQLDQSGKMQDRIHRKGYISGHMLYMRRAALKKGTNDLRQFIKNSIPEEGHPIKYHVPRKDLNSSGPEE
jgi:carboxypeptidase C (cathepsin A)